LFPHWDFNSVKTDKDNLWVPAGEPEENWATRGLYVLNWLWKRKETEIGVVGHGGIFDSMMAKNDSVDVDSKIGSTFDNCELRSMRLYLLPKGRFRLEAAK